LGDAIRTTRPHGAGGTDGRLSTVLAMLHHLAQAGEVEQRRSDGVALRGRAPIATDASG
jgi:hypothetical protein